MFLKQIDTESEQSSALYSNPKNTHTHKRSSFYLYPDFPFYWRIKMQIKIEEKKNPKMLSVLMSFETKWCDAFIPFGRSRLRLRLSQSQSWTIIFVWTWSKWMFAGQPATSYSCGPNVGVHLHVACVSAARRGCRSVYKTALQDANSSITHCLPILPKGEIAFS